MRRALLTFALIAPAISVSGCAAIAVPVLAAGVIGGKQVLDRDPDGRRNAAPAPVPSPALVSTAGQAAPAPGDGSIAAPAPTSVPAPAPAPGMLADGFRYLYGSGEAAALSEQAYNQLISYLRARADDRIAGYPVASVVLAPGSTLDRPGFTGCDEKPLAVVLDIDETSILNLGYEADEARRGGGYDPDRWDRWEATGTDAVVAVPGAVRAVTQARKLGITVIFNSNRSSAHALETAQALAKAGLGAAKLGTTLFLRAPGASGAKDARRTQIAGHFCVVAMVGDQLGDFSDLFNAPGLSPAQRRAAADNEQFQSLWGAGWFVLPNPVYGPALKGGIDDVFPADKRWTDPGDAPAPVPAPPPGGSPNP